MSREAMKHIKTWSERCEEHPDHQERIITERMIQARMQEEIDELRQALETEQEPVAWITDGGKGELWWYQSSKFDEEGNLIGPNPDDIPLYTEPSKQWVGLTDEEVSEAIDDVLEGGGWLDVARALEAKIKEKNT